MTDNGGAIAQKGFNYQSAVISLVAIRNYKKSNFEIYIETDDDFEVLYGSDYHAYIQVKGHKSLSLKTLLNSNKGKPSIIEKNLSSGDELSQYKIVVYKFTEKDLKEMDENFSEELFEKGYIFSESQKQQIKNSRSNNLSLILTDFKTESKPAFKYLVGEMHAQGISVDKKADLIINELFKLISQKAEKEIQCDSDRQLKKISVEELTPIIQKVTALETFDVILCKFRFSEIRNKKIQIEKNRIAVEYSWYRNKIRQEMKKSDLEQISEVELINGLIDNELFNGNQVAVNAKYAICISAYCDLVEELENE